MSLDRQIEDLERLRAALGIERMALLGWSGLGMEMAVYAIRHPDRVTRLVQVGAVPPAARIMRQSGGDRRDERMDRAAIAALDQRNEAGEFATDPAAFCRARGRLTVPANFADAALAARVPDACRYENEWPLHLWPYFEALLGSMGDFDWLDEIGALDIPRLVVHGREDGIPLAGARAWAAGFPNARLLVLSPAGHFPFLEQPDTFFPAVNRFLSGEWPAAAEPVEIALALMGAPPTSAISQRPPHAPIVIANVNVVPMDRERVLAGQTVVVERGVISQMGPPRSVTIPAGAQTIDGTGKYLIPGLVDLHVHLASNPEDDQRAILKLFVVNGVTTVLNLRGTPQILDLRAAVAAGRVFGPTLYTSGPFVNEPFVTTPDEVERAVSDQKRAGYDFVKLHGNLSREAYARLNAVARREGIRVVGHAPRNLGVAAMFEERQYAVAHAEEFLYDQTNSSRDQDLPQVEAQIAELARSMAQAGIWLMPNLTAFKIIGLQVKDLDAVLARPEMRFMPRSVREGWGPGS